jgi:hypothetical protein
MSTPDADLVLVADEDGPRERTHLDRRGRPTHGSPRPYFGFDIEP